MSLEYFNLSIIVKIISVVCAFVMVLSSLEYLKSYYLLSNESYLSWNITKYKCKLPLKGWVGKIVEYFFSYEFYRYVIILRLLSAVIILLFALFDLHIPSLVFGIAALSTISLSVRGMYGLDGSYHMNIIVIVSLFLYSLFPYESFEAILCIYFIGVQGILSYFIAGLTKIQGKMWRNGEAVIGIFGTKTYGNQMIYKYLNKYEHVSLALGWFIIIFEVCFVLIMVVPIEYKLFILLIGVCFHAFNSLFMGLNNFFFSFLSSYPAIFFLAMIR